LRGPPFSAGLTFRREGKLTIVGPTALLLIRRRASAICA
jgi:hypothetical protein